MNARRIKHAGSTLARRSHVAGAGATGATGNTGDGNGAICDYAGDYAGTAEGGDVAVIITEDRKPSDRRGFPRK